MAVEPTLQYFQFDHLQRDDLKAIAREFSAFALAMVAQLPPGPERTFCLRKLVEAKDCAVRAKVYQLHQEPVDA